VCFIHLKPGSLRASAGASVNSAGYTAALAEASW